MRRPIPPDGMLVIPGGTFHYHATHRFREGGLLHFDEGPRTVQIGEFSLDRYEVTNAEYKRFLDASGYRPAEPRNFLRHWQGSILDALPNQPVTWVSLADA